MANLVQSIQSIKEEIAQVPSLELRNEFLNWAGRVELALSAGTGIPASSNGNEATRLLLPSSVEGMSVKDFFKYFDAAAIDETIWVSLKDQFQLWLLNQENRDLASADDKAEFASGVTQRAKLLGYRFACQTENSVVATQSDAEASSTSSNLCSSPAGLRWAKNRAVFGAFYFGHMPQVTSDDSIVETEKRAKVKRHEIVCGHWPSIPRLVLVRPPITYSPLS